MPLDLRYICVVFLWRIPTSYFMKNLAQFHGRANMRFYPCMVSHSEGNSKDRFRNCNRENGLGPSFGTGLCCETLWIVGFHTWWTRWSAIACDLWWLCLLSFRGIFADFLLSDLGFDRMSVFPKDGKFVLHEVFLLEKPCWTENNIF